MNLEKAFLFFRVSPVHVRDDMALLRRKCFSSTQRKNEERETGRHENMALAPVCHRPVGRQIFSILVLPHCDMCATISPAWPLCGCTGTLRYVAKPKLTIVVTGTNRKTTISALIAGVLRKEGKSVSFNDWGPTIMQVWPGACWTRWTSSTALLRTPWWWN